MLDLQARVHLDEVPGGRRPERAALDQELHRAGALVADRLGTGDRGGRDLGAQLRRHAGRGGLLDHLLVAPLQRAVALEEVYDVAVRVAEHLHLDVAGTLDHFLDEDAGVAERGLRLALRALERGGELPLARNETHAAPAASGHRLDHDGKADALGLACQRLGALLVAVVAGHDRHAGRRRDRLGLGLAAHAPHGLRRRADELDAGLAGGSREVGVLGQEAVARVDRLGLGLARRRDDPVAAQIAFGRGPRADLDHLVGHAREGRAAVCLRAHGNRADAQPARGLDDADGDLAPVGDQDLFEHGLPPSPHALRWGEGRGEGQRKLRRLLLPLTLTLSPPAGRGDCRVMHCRRAPGNRAVNGAPRFL